MDGRAPAGEAAERTAVTIREDLFERAFERALDAAVAPELWPDALALLAAASGAAGAALISSASVVGGLVTSDSLAAVAREMSARNGELVNSRMERGLRLVRSGFRGLVTEAHIFTPEELLRDAFQGMMERHGYRSFAGQVILRHPETQIVLTLERRPAEGIFTSDELDRLDDVFRRMRGVARLAAEFGLRQGLGMVDAFDRLAVPALLLGATGRTLRANEQAAQLVGDVIDLRAGRPVARVKAANAHLQAEIDRSTKDSAARHVRAGAPVMLPRPGDPRPVVADLVPLPRPAGDIFAPARAIMLMSDLRRRPRAPFDRLRQLFRLTHREAKLLGTLAEGVDLAEAAERLGITVNTARAHLKALFAKTETRRQGELIALVARVARGLVDG